MTPNLELLVEYACPHCGTSIETYADAWLDWRLCPRCHRAARPPASGVVGPEAREEVLFLDDGPNTSFQPVVRPAPRRTTFPSIVSTSGSPVGRVVTGVVFLLLAALGVIAAAQGEMAQTVILSLIAIVVLVVGSRL